jgi:hypothetical protein
MRPLTLFRQIVYTCSIVVSAALSTRVIFLSFIFYNKYADCLTYNSTIISCYLIFSSLFPYFSVILSII